MQFVPWKNPGTMDVEVVNVVDKQAALRDERLVMVMATSTTGADVHDCG